MWMWILLAALAAFLGGAMCWIGSRPGEDQPVIPTVNRDAPCPSCGHRDGELRFDAELKLVVHTCRVCKANWGEKTVVDPAGWVSN